MKRAQVRVEVDVGSSPSASAESIARAVRLTLRAEGQRKGEISVALLDDAHMQELNRTWLAKDRTTDVIAFSLGGEDEVVGDVYVGYEQAARQAADLGVSLDEELVRLAIHGTLHVLGHDHPEGNDRDGSPMFLLQERLVRESMGDSAAD